MKKFNYILLLCLGVSMAFFSCDRDEIDTAALTNFPPSILSIFPATNVTVGEFDVKVIFADGSISPLSNASVRLSDDSGNELASVSQGLSGIRDSVVIEGSSFNAIDLPLGFYNIDIEVTDSDGQVTSRTSRFELSLLPFAANHNEMYIAGVFNGWGFDVMELVDDNIWEIKEVDLQGDAFKFKNCVDWCDEDWGDEGCDGIMDSNMGPDGNGNTACNFSGLVNVRFNDNTLQYTVEPAITFASNVSGLFLLGSFNNFEGEDYPFNLIEDNIWELAEVELNQGDFFRFAEMPDFMGKNFGDADGDGQAEEFGPNIEFMEQSAFYKVTFNDRTLVYSFEFIRFPSIGIIGSATPGGWDNDTDMTDNGDGTFSINVELVDGEAKFRANDAWTVNWGGADFPSGIAEQDGPNIPVTAGRYDVTFNPGTGEYNFVLDPGIISLGIIGSATPGGWDSDTDMNDNGDGTYSLLVGLVDGEAKFRTNDDWAVNWGAGDFPSGTGELDGSNIPVTAGLYLVTFNAETQEYRFDPATVGIIGDSTPGGWDSDTDLNFDAATPNTLTLSVTLTDGEAKFRLNDDWATNWGAGDFPAGTATQDGPNIPVTAGSYNITFNVLTAEYSFN